MLLDYRPVGDYSSPMTTLAERLILAFPEKPPFLERAIDERLLAELLPDKPQRLQHILGVVALGRELASDLKASPETAWRIDQVTLAHDIGYAEALRRTGYHPLDGAVFLAHRGAEEAQIHAVLHHSGAREGAKVLPAAWPFYSGLPPFAATFLSDAVTYCDTQTSPQGARVTIAQRIAEVETRYGVDSPTGRAMRVMEPEFDAIHRRISALRIGPAPGPARAGAPVAP